MHALLMANAPFSDEALPFLQRAIAQVQVRIGVDGGARTLLRLGFCPDVVTGDGDSLTDEERESLVRAGARFVATPDQDFTDLDKALTYSRETLGITEASIFGATGGRLDHSYSVFSTLIKHGTCLRLRLVDETATYFLVGEQETLTGEALRGRTLSLLAFGRVEGVTTTGLRWPLTNDWLAPGLRDGTLNEIVESSITLKVGSGSLIAMLHHE